MNTVNRSCRATWQSLSICLLWLAAALLWTGCPDQGGTASTGNADSIEAAGPSEQVTITDGNGERLTIGKPVERIVVEYMDNAELLRILGRTDLVVGVAGYDYVFEQCRRQFPVLRTRPSVGYPWSLDYEAILALKPDLLLTFNADTQAKRANLPGVGVVFLGLYYPDLVDPSHARFINGVRNLGRLLDAEDRAETFIRWHTELLQTITSRTRTLPVGEKPRVLISSFPQCHSAGSNYCVYSSHDTLAQACQVAGGNDIAGQLNEYQSSVYSLPVDVEWIMAQDPQIIVLHAVDAVDLYGYETDDISGLRQGWRHYLLRPELAHVAAVKNRQVYIFDGHFRNDASGGIVAAAYMAKLFHPERFEDLNPEEIQRQYLAFQGLSYDLDRHGIFVFPPLRQGQGLMGIPDRYRDEAF